MPDQSSRIIRPDALAESLGVDVSPERQRAFDALIDNVVSQYGPLAVLRTDPEKGDSFVGVFSEYVIAEIMKPVLGDQLVPDRANGRYYAFDDSGGIFKTSTREEVGRIVSRVYAALPKLSSKLEPLKARPVSVRMMSGILSALTGTLGENYPFGGDPDAHPTVIHKPVANGLLSFDLTSDEPPSFRTGLCPSDRALHRAPVIYDPAAGSVPSRLLNELLIPALGCAETAEEFLDDFAGAWLGGALWPFCLILVGAADSGKSQLVEMLRAFIGDPHWNALSAKNASDKFGSSFFAGPINCISLTDAKQNALVLLGELIKQLTGGDVIEDRGPHASLLTKIVGNKVFLLTSNAVPCVDLNDDAEAFDRRLRPFRFNSYPVEKRIADFGQVLLREEGSIILNRLIEGGRRRIRLRIDGKRPSMLPRMKELMDEILRRSCLCASYCESRITAEHGCQINRTELFSMFSDSLRERNQRPWTRETFNKRSAEVMKRAFGSPVSNSLEGGKGWRSVRFKTPTEIDNDD